MSSLETNKIVAAILTAGVIAMTAGFLSRLLVEPEPLEEDAFPVAVAESEGPQAEEAPAEAGIEPVLPLLAEADPANGERLAKACKACHSFEQGGPNKVGPNLWNVVGSPIASVEGFSYSDALAGLEGEWSYAKLNEFIAGPRDFAPGTKMSYGGMSKVADRADLIAWLRSLSDSPQPLPSPADAADAEAEPAAESAQAASEAPAGEAAPADAGEQPAADTGGGGDGGGIKSQIAAADPAAGEKAARKCAACHSFEQGGPNKVGPNLFGVVGASMGHRDDYNYSDAVAQKQAEGAQWTYENLWAFLEDPRGWLPGTKMSFAGVKKEAERAAIISYLRQQSDNPPPLE